MNMSLTIATLSLQKTYDISWLECETSAGNFMILPGHAPLVCALKPHSPIRFALSSGAVEEIMLDESLMYVDRHTISILGS